MTQEKISGTERALQRDNFLAIINVFPMEHLEKGTEKRQYGIMANSK